MKKRTYIRQCGRCGDCYKTRFKYSKICEKCILPKDKRKKRKTKEKKLVYLIETIKKEKKN